VPVVLLAVSTKQRLMKVLIVYVTLLTVDVSEIGTTWVDDDVAVGS
jgi:hypothetical protein